MRSVTDTTDKLCPTCGTRYPPAERFCPRDGTALKAESGTAVVGSVIADRYHVISKLGEGGMGQVYLAEHVKMGRKSAVKLMNPGLDGDADAISRFNREAANASRINHPNVAGIYDFGETSDGLIFLAMEFIEGESLTSLVTRSGPLAPVRAADITRQVAEGLEAAHERGIVHRDLKPDNIMIAKGRAGADLVKVVDFGIAKGAADNQKVTRTGLSVGTPEYMSPEQFTGDTVESTSDIYSLGLVAFNMFTGEMAFQGTSARELMVKRLSSPPRTLAEARPGVAWPDSVLQVMDKALAPEVAERYQSAVTFAQDLGSAVAEMPDRSSHATEVMPSSANVLAGARPSIAARRSTSSALSAPQPTSPPSRRHQMVIALTLMGAVAVAVAFASGMLGDGGSQPGTPTAGVAPKVTADSGMVLIPTGDYTIGANDGPPLARPSHTVRVGAFAIDRTEVTMGAYKAFVDMTKAPAPWAGEMPEASLPVTGVRWGDARNYCAWRHTEGGRLPTEAEWEAAARGPSGRAFPYGATAEAVNANTASAARRRPVPVGSFPWGATPEGVQDMSGNVWEWTNSPLVAYPGATPLADSLSQYRVIRGGAFDTNDNIASAFVRGYLKATAASPDLPNTGFRCAVSAPVNKGL